jgi:site-specific DNA-methyltransferase (adenine-specific)
MNVASRIIHSDLLKYLHDYSDIVRNGYMPKYHAVLCDPPYGIDFMNKQWDKYIPQAYQAWVTEWASLLLDFVHPGGVLMAFGGTRTYHRLVCGLEDAGWEIYDSIATWNYGSGFPKSHDISKAIDNAAGAEREVVGDKLNLPGYHLSPGGGHILGNGKSLHGHREDARQRAANITAPATPLAEQWSGYGTALKPSYEPIVIARKPRNGFTYAECAVNFGSGALNIDGCRIAVDDSDPNHRNSTGGYKPELDEPRHIFGKDLYNRSRDATLTEGRWPANTMLVHHPDCNDTCHPECHVRVMGEQSGIDSGVFSKQTRKRKGFMLSGSENNIQEANAPDNYGDTGTAARFFYQAKAAKWERGAGLGDMPLKQSASMQGNLIDGQRLSGKGEPIKTPMRRNPHPTVKPIQLIEQLATLLKPPIADSRILIPFSGSGSEMIGAYLAGWQTITGIEMTSEYIPIARARLAWWQRFNSYAMAEAHAKNHSDNQMTLFEALSNQDIA